MEVGVFTLKQLLATNDSVPLAPVVLLRSTDCLPLPPPL